ncbi:MAG: TRAM domain-containing protein [Spirochaetes bacterium]|nr:TRAM domain-containing protein [Spirochaetota bacterium]
MILFLRIAFIVINGAFSFFHFLQISLTAAFVALLVSALISLLIIIIIEYVSHSIDARIIVSAIVGLLVGLALAHLMVLALSTIPIPFIENYATLIASIIYYLTGFGMMMFGAIKHDEIALIDAIVPKKKDEEADKGASYKILDTSVIIDGRIADICDTGFIEGILVIPNFVLNELQMIADSADSIKRNRGRRGLDILNKMQKDRSVVVKISDIDFKDIPDVDAKLVKLAKIMKAKVITNDFNLNKVAEFHGVKVLNINQLSNALKPVVLPGEDMRVLLLKEGKDQNQAIGYLDDGTMVVVENGRRRINSEVDVTVTSVLQTTAGRMIFARLKEEA